MTHPQITYSSVSAANDLVNVEVEAAGGVVVAVAVVDNVKVVGWRLALAHGHLVVQESFDFGDFL